MIRRAEEDVSEMRDTNTKIRSRGYMIGGRNLPVV